MPLNMGMLELVELEEVVDEYPGNIFFSFGVFL